jgi:glycosyltransferase involved in cell wall biosynthesis
MTDTALHPKPIVLIPAYQPGQALVDTVRKLLAAGLTVVVVNDGSEAAFDPIFKALDPTVHVIAHSVNRGKGAALKTGYAYIRDNFRDYIIITADSDGQHAVADIKKWCKPIPINPTPCLKGSKAS